ncbi:unnamed protein product [Amoebophrya sp. A120]|nr:unnamed protein product [Amoebophrya sp. A120]|eukprot:GSA120T00008155001.1
MVVTIPSGGESLAPSRYVIFPLSKIYRALFSFRLCMTSVVHVALCEHLHAA